MILALGTGASGDTFIVKPDRSGGFPTIQAAIAVAQDGDVIELTDGVYRGEGNRDMTFLGKAITVRSQSDDPELCLIDCEGTADDPHRGFIFEHRERETSILEGIGITRGYAPPATGPTLGGGIWCKEFTGPTIRGCEISFCYAEGGGGALSNGAYPTFTECTFRQNSANQGGGLYASGENGMVVIVTNCRFEENISETEGGGFYVLGPEATFDDCIFSNNRSGMFGGAGVIYCSSDGYFERCIFANNLAQQGGAIHMKKSSSHLTISSCTFYGNCAPLDATITHADYAHMSIANTIIASSIECRAIITEWCTSVTLECCDLYGNDLGDWVGCIEDQFGINGNICEDPMFCDAENGDFSISSDSPCSCDGTGATVCGLIGARPAGCGTTGIDEHGLVSSGLRLEPFVPNPFGGSTRITYSLPRGFDGSRVQIRVYDPMGRLVETLVNSPRPQGMHTLSWDVSNKARERMSAGIYFVQLRARGEQLTRRVILTH
jgi:predicted outer membrane repeat protein